MELSEKLIQVKSSAKLEKDFVFTQDDEVFFFGDVIRPVGQIPNHNDPSECYVLFPPAAPMHEISGLAEDPTWVGDFYAVGFTQAITCYTYHSK